MKDPKSIYYDKKYIFNHWNNYLPSLTMLSHDCHCYILISIFSPLSIVSLSQSTTLIRFLPQPTSTQSLYVSQLKFRKKWVLSSCPIPSEWQPSLSISGILLRRKMALLNPSPTHTPLFYDSPSNIFFHCPSLRSVKLSPLSQS